MPTSGGKKKTSNGTRGRTRSRSGSKGRTRSTSGSKGRGASSGRASNGRAEVRLNDLPTTFGVQLHPVYGEPSVTYEQHRNSQYFPKAEEVTTPGGTILANFSRKPSSNSNSRGRSSHSSGSHSSRGHSSSSRSSSLGSHNSNVGAEYEQFLAGLPPNAAALVQRVPLSELRTGSLHRGTRRNNHRLPSLRRSRSNP
jgi:hypothetical protein